MKSKIVMVLIIILIILGVIFIILNNNNNNMVYHDDLSVASSVESYDLMNQVLENTANVELKGFNNDSGDYGLEIVAKNLSDSPINIQIEIKAYEDETCQNMINSEEVVLRGLQVEEESTYFAFSHDLSIDEINKLKSAVFKITKVEII